ncbi:MAG: DNA polymerase III subunit gamma/tau [Phycisphaerae bacterium]|nr:DNA polymerase III subunit gamma/tau [Phycisphaerae bacterium]
MAGYLVLARKYRSETFPEVVGQEPIAQTLTNAVKTGRIAHAYLFTGTRGVGKTTMARILAKALNCLSTDAPTPTPCCQCDACQAVARGDDVDVIEIDGASNRGIDEIRELRNNAIFRPARCRFKVYYIDEVHMLTKEAFNALLKTLEEPPSHVKFIFATTEVEKVPATILSRCQRFDFRNIPTAKIAEHLQAICQKEDVSADADALYRVARAAAGSMRDGLSLLDQLLAGAEKVTDEEVIRVLGTPPDEKTIAVIQALAESNAAAALSELAAVLDSGVTLTSVTTALGEMFRNMMLSAACGANSDLIELPETQRKTVGELASRFSTPVIVQAVGVLQQTARNIRGSSVGRALLEAALVRLAEAEKFIDPASLIERLEQFSAGGLAAGQKKKSVINTPANPSATAGTTRTPPVAQPPTPNRKPSSPEPEAKKYVKPLSSDEKQKVQDDSAVREVMTLFGGEMVHVERVETPDPAVVPPGADEEEE